MIWRFAFDYGALLLLTVGAILVRIDRVDAEGAIDWWSVFILICYASVIARCVEVFFWVRRERERRKS